MFSKNLIHALELIYILAVFVGPSQGQGMFYDDEDCSEMGSWCLFNHHCCSKYCIALTCSECRKLGEACFWNSDCCTGFCIGFDCEECRKVGERCFFASDCCSYQCNFNYCGEKTYFW
ncbi:unnamed protein product [Allacma fusca]|uniref:Uncharacterized protein n=1 Tax=Allacma fusca TaxID=39272 RepID=A0A8J2JYX9_9HEXA|nr:unnamed protein product [Allacma fusca]